MLVFRIISTVFIALSIITSYLKNVCVCHYEDLPKSEFWAVSLYSTLWRAFVIVSIWLI